MGSGWKSPLRHQMTRANALVIAVFGSGRGLPNTHLSAICQQLSADKLSDPKRRYQPDVEVPGQVRNSGIARQVFDPCADVSCRNSVAADPAALVRTRPDRAALEQSRKASGPGTRTKVGCLVAHVSRFASAPTTSLSSARIRVRSLAAASGWRSPVSEGSATPSGPSWRHNCSRTR